MNVPKLSKRLEAAASFSRRGARFADIGTDHAYLPIYLCTTKKSDGGVASDINEGPTERARINVRAWGVQKGVDVTRADGLDGIEKYKPDDVFILGMGGELIARIISEAEWLKSEDKRLILQPMTHPEAVRRYLCENGFLIVDEALAKEEKIYQIICAEYVGENERMSDFELFLGKKNIESGGEVFNELLAHTKKVFLGRIEGKQSAGADATQEIELVKKIDEILGGEK